MLRECIVQSTFLNDSHLFFTSHCIYVCPLAVNVYTTLLFLLSLLTMRKKYLAVLHNARLFFGDTKY